jgi:hypothetical protein
MSREIDQDPRPERERTGPLRAREGRRAPEPPEPSRDREIVRDRNRVWQLSAAERRTLFEIGRFRTVALEDLARHLYGGRAGRLRDDLRSLSAQGLVAQRRAPVRSRKGTLEVVVLTPAATRLLEPDRARTDQALYSGFVKPSEVAHDAAIYRMFHAEKQRIEREGGSIRRVALDYEWKRKAYAPLARARHLPKPEFAQKQADVARAHGLAVVQGRLVLPDLRIEYETSDGDLARVDLELATGHYHGSHLQAKAQAGFRFYVADGSAGRLTRILQERDIAASLLSL